MFGCYSFGGGLVYAARDSASDAAPSMKPKEIASNATATYSEIGGTDMGVRGDE